MIFWFDCFLMKLKFNDHVLLCILIFKLKVYLLKKNQVIRYKNKCTESIDRRNV